MGRLKQIKIGVDAVTEARLSVRAKQAGTSVSEYVRVLILRDIAPARGGDGDLPAADVSRASLTPQLLELALVTGILVRAQLGQTVGEDEARKLQVRAQAKAAEQMKAILGASEEETVS